MTTISSANLDLSQRVAENAKDPQAIAGQKAESAEQIKKISQDFESLFMEIVLKSMRSTVSKSGLMDGGNGEDVFRSMLDSEYAKSMAGQGPSGIAASIENQLLGILRERNVKIDAAAGTAKYQQMK